MKKLGYLAIALIGVIALGSCKIYIAPDTPTYGDNYIRVEWYGGPDTNKPTSWSGDNPAIANSVYNPASVSDLADVRTAYTTNAGSYYFTYRDYNNNVHTINYSIPTNDTSYDIDYVIYLDVALANGGKLYTDGYQPSESVRTAK